MNTLIQKQNLTIITEIDEAKYLTDKTAITIDVGDDLSVVSTNSEFIVPVASFLSVSTPPPSSSDSVIPLPVSPIASIPTLSPVHVVTYSSAQVINQHKICKGYSPVLIGDVYATNKTFISLPKSVPLFKWCKYD